MYLPSTSPGGSNYLGFQSPNSSSSRGPPFCRVGITLSSQFSVACYWLSRLLFAIGLIGREWPMRLSRRELPPLPTLLLVTLCPLPPSINSFPACSTFSTPANSLSSSSSSGPTGPASSSSPASPSNIDWISTFCSAICSLSCLAWSQSSLSMARWMRTLLSLSFLARLWITLIVFLKQLAPSQSSSSIARSLSADSLLTIWLMYFSSSSFTSYSSSCASDSSTSVPSPCPTSAPSDPNTLSECSPIWLKKLSLAWQGLWNSSRRYMQLMSTMMVLTYRALPCSLRLNCKQPYLQKRCCWLGIGTQQSRSTWDEILRWSETNYIFRMLTTPQNYRVIYCGQVQKRRVCQPYEPPNSSPDTGCQGSQEEQEMILNLSLVLMYYSKIVTEALNESSQHSYTHRKRHASIVTPYIINNSFSRILLLHSMSDPAMPSMSRSTMVLDIKGYEAEQDLDSLALKVKQIQKEGLVWHEVYQKSPIAFGVMKLVMKCEIDDQYVSIDDLISQIEQFEDEVQSVDIASFIHL